ncbi:hypothetical protein K7W42_09860 [Deinococcus sp. HMF7604]|uniref:hypothetical protein n=1 Tax=Deinococcus betulae TaxID=2873312 RepID=UPI001CCDF0E1|nr:hypothetical protein [Deinococcus betulae]MBZ9751168.1 hypothetical protein [Deinococcus betulae]
MGDTLSAPTDLAEVQGQTLAGFTVLLAPALRADPALQDRLLWRVEEQLQEALRVLPAQSHSQLRRVRVWIDPRVEPGGLAPQAWYVRLRSQTAQRGDIVLVDPQGLIALHGQYNLLLHELTHAYDDRAHGFRHPAVLAAFQEARKTGHYTDAEFDAYAMSRSEEYFAELTLAYFAARPTTPRNRRELQAFDPAGAAAVAQAWKVR